MAIYTSAISASSHITASGNISASGPGSFAMVGIGTTSPSEKLHLYGNANADVKLKIENDFSGKNANLILDSGASGDGYIIFNEGGTTRGLIIYDGGTDVLKIINDGSTASTHLAISSSGNVGMGTFSPDEKLEVVGNISASGTGSFSDGRFTGNVGIGTTSPALPLHIVANETKWVA